MISTATKEMISTMKGKIPDIILWVIMCIIAIIILQKNDEIQEIKIVEARERIKEVQEQCESGEKTLLLELKEIRESIERNRIKEQEHYEDIIQRVSKIEN